MISSLLMCECVASFAMSFCTARCWDDFAVVICWADGSSVSSFCLKEDGIFEDRLGGAGKYFGSMLIKDFVAVIWSCVTGKYEEKMWWVSY